MTLPGAEIGEASTTESGKPRQLFGLLSQQGSMSEMELPVTESTPVALKSPPPAAKAKIDKENLTLADRIRSPALDTSCSKDQWRTIAIQAAARANGDVYEEWRDMAPMRALDLQPEGDYMSPFAGGDEPTLEIYSASEPFSRAELLQPGRLTHNCHGCLSPSCGLLQEAALCGQCAYLLIPLDEEKPQCWHCTSNYSAALQKSTMWTIQDRSLL